MDPVLTTPDEGDKGTKYSEGSAKDLDGLSPERLSP